MYEVFILTAEWGEYEAFTSEVRGVFSSLDAAKDAVAAMPEICRKTWERHEEVDREKKAWLDQNAKERRTTVSEYFGSLTSYGREDYAEANRLFPSPAFWVGGGVIYRVLAAKVDANHPDDAPVEVWNSEGTADV